MYFTGKTDPQYGSKIKQILELSSSDQEQESSESYVEPVPQKSKCFSCDKRVADSEEFLAFKARVVEALKTDSEFRKFAEEVMFNQFVRK